MIKSRFDRYKKEKKKPNKITYEIDWCEQSSVDDDKQQLFADRFRSRCRFEFEIFSSSIVVFVAGKHKGGGGSFFDRNKQFVVGELVSISIVATQRLVFFNHYYQRRSNRIEKERKTSLRRRVFFFSAA